jgi:hypothetical protein
MNLAEAIQKALESTRSVAASLDAGRLDRCLVLLQARAAVMAAFETAHRAAPQAERNACRDALEELLAGDVELQRRTSLALDEVASAFRESLTMVSRPAGSGTDGTQTGCLDRKA